MTKTTRTGKDVITKLYMCSTDFDFELGQAIGHTMLYSSIEDLKADKACVTCPHEEHPCGIYEVEVRLVKIIKESSF